jgi:hypothetical protein
MHPQRAGQSQGLASNAGVRRSTQPITDWQYSNAVLLLSLSIGRAPLSCSGEFIARTTVYNQIRSMYVLHLVGSQAVTSGCKWLVHPYGIIATWQRCCAHHDNRDERLVARRVAVAARRHRE